MKRAVAWALCGVVLCAGAQDMLYGRFVGEVKTRWLEDGRKMELLDTLAFIDRRSVTWEAPKGWVIDGASIPQFAWSLVGGPYDHKYRVASVIHDVACDRKLRRWEAVHEAFHDAMRAAGVEPMRASLLYGAVYHFGPRWPYKVTEYVPVAEAESKLDALRAQIDPRSRVDVAAEAFYVSGLGVGGRPEKIATGLTKLTLDVAPAPPALRYDDMARLAQAIEEKGLSLEQIRAYVPSR